MIDPGALGSQAAAVRLLAREVRMRAAAVRGQATEQRATARAHLAQAANEVRALRARLSLAENRGESLERALASSRRLGMAVGILMYRDQLTEEQAFAVLRTESQRQNKKARELAETLVYTGTL
jgi:AmiR/NasT family two-component response regulator